MRFVAANGSDANKCTRGKPCRTIQRGVNRTPDGGELQILTSGDYPGAVNIARSITISAVGVSATLTGGTITIDNAGAKVMLRGLLLNGQNAGAGASGIVIDNAASVHIANCEVERYAQDGIVLDAADARLFVSHSVMTNNSGDGLVAVSGKPNMKLTVDGSRFENNGGRGMAVGVQSSVTRSVVSGNGSSGVFVFAERMNVTTTIAENNGLSGFQAQGPSAVMTIKSAVGRGNAIAGLRNISGVVNISDSVFTDNGFGIRNTDGGSVFSLGDNLVTGNITDDIDGDPPKPLPGI